MRKLSLKNPFSRKISKNLLFSGTIIAIFCISFFFFTPITNKLPNNYMNSISKPKNSEVLANSNPTGDEWPMFHDSLNHTGVTKTTPVGGNGTIWNYTTGSCIESSPAIANGMVYVGSVDYNLYCLNASSGNKIWSYKTNKYIESSPAIANGKVYFGSDDCNFYCLNGTTGHQIWYYPVNGITYSSPAVLNGFVYFGSDDKNIYCLNSTNGSLAWKFTTGGAIDSSPAISSGLIYFGSGDKNLYCLNATNGNFVWNYTTGYCNYDYNYESSPTITNGFLYIGSDNGTVYCLNALNGSLIWKYLTYSQVDSTPTILNGIVYICSISSFYCLNASDGGLLWQRSIGGASSPAIACGMVYFDDNYHFYCLNASTGDTIWSYESIWFSSSPAIANGKVYVGDDYGNLYCFPMVFPPQSSPTNLQLIHGINQIKLSWQPPKNNGGSPITHYNIYRGSTSENEVFLTSVSNILSYTDSALPNNTTYYYKVSAVNSVGDGPQSTEVNATTATIPSAPSNLQVIAGDKQINLNWQAPSDNGGSPITNYRIYYRTSSENEKSLAIIGNIKTYTATNLSMNTQYFFTVSAINSVGEGLQSSEVSATTLTYPGQPLNFQAIAGDKQINLNWQAPSDNGGSQITGYKIYRGTTAGSEVLLTTVGNVLTYTDTGLVNNITYYYQVSAITTVGQGSKSSEISATPTASISTNSTINPNSTNNPNSTSKNHSIDGMNISEILMIGLLGVIFSIATTKRKIKYRFG